MRTKDLNEREGRSLALLRFGHTDEEFLQQQVTPRHGLRTDLVLQLGAEVPCVWGPLEELLANRRTAVEFVSGGLGVDAARRHFAASLFHGQEGRPAIECQLMTVCFREPRARLRELGGLVTPGPVPGIWLGDLGGCGRWVVVAVDDLPVINGTSVLRLTHLRKSPKELGDRLHHLLTDPHITPTIQVGITEDLLMNKIPSNIDERHLTSQQLMDRGEARGRVEAARETWLEVARLLLPQATADALESQPTEVIRAAVEATTRK